MCNVHLAARTTTITKNVGMVTSRYRLIVPANWYVSPRLGDNRGEFVRKRHYRIHALRLYILVRWLGVREKTSLSSPLLKYLHSSPRNARGITTLLITQKQLFSAVLPISPDCPGKCGIIFAKDNPACYILDELNGNMSEWHLESALFSCSNCKNQSGSLSLSKLVVSSCFKYASSRCSLPFSEGDDCSASREMSFQFKRAQREK